MNAKLLALALGWKLEQMKPCTNDSAVLIKREDGVWCDLSVKSKEHFWEICKRFEVFPQKSGTRWAVEQEVYNDSIFFYGATPEEAVYEFVVNRWRKL